MFRDREDVRKTEDSKTVDKALRDLFAERMKHNKMVFNEDIMEEDKPKRKLAKAADSEKSQGDDGEVNYFGAENEKNDDIVHTPEDGLTPNDNEVKKEAKAAKVSANDNDNEGEDDLF